MAKSSGGIRGNGNKNYTPALEDYISGDGMWVNSWLRDKNYELSDSEKKYLSDLDKATMNNLGSKTLFRSVDASSIFGNISSSEYESLLNTLAFDGKQKYDLNIANKVISKVKIGSIQSQEGFMSTSKSRKTAEGWSGFSGSEKPIVMKISTSKNTKGVDLSKHRMRQQEVLLKRGVRYRINKIYGANGRIYVDVTII